MDRTNWKRGKQHLKEISSEARYLASQDEDSRFIHQWFEGLPKGKSQTVVLELGKTAGVTTALTAKRLEDDSLIIVSPPLFKLRRKSIRLRQGYGVTRG